MSNPGWKKFERRIAEALGGRRVGILGKEDVEHELLSVECKLLKSLPKFLTDAYGQAYNNSPENKIPVVCMKKKKLSDDKAFVIMNFKDFLAILEEK